MSPEKSPTNPRGAGRKPAPAADKHKTRTFKCTDGQWEKINKLAEEAGLPTSEYIRLKALQSK